MSHKPSPLLDPAFEDRLDIDGELLWDRLVTECRRICARDFPEHVARGPLHLVRRSNAWSPLVKEWDLHEEASK